MEKGDSVIKAQFCFIVFINESNFQGANKSIAVERYELISYFNWVNCITAEERMMLKAKIKARIKKF